MQTHTPGPWRIGDAGLTVFGPPNGKPSPETIAQTRNRANARLIAAAPDLLEELLNQVKNINGDIEAHLENGETERDVAFLVSRRDSMLAAIAKATGRGA